MHLWFKRVSTFTTSLCIVYSFNAILSNDITIKRLRKKTDVIMETGHVPITKYINLYKRRRYCFIDVGSCIEFKVLYHL